jgi:glycosyltransferase involved in cell wall biosynthesis
MNKISLAVPYYNNSNFLKSLLEYPCSEERIGEIIICDDKSEDIVEAEKIIESFNSEKIKLIKNNENLGVYLNKIRSLENCSFEWAILFDSDNIIGKDYLDVIYSEDWECNKILAPSYIPLIDGNGSHVSHCFDFRSFIGDKIGSHNFFDFLRIGPESNFTMMMNTCNYFVNVEKYTECFIKNSAGYNFYQISSADSFTLFSDWIYEGNFVKVCDKLSYMHRIHDSSTYTQTCQRLDAEAWKNLCFSKIERSRIEY